MMKPVMIGSRKWTVNGAAARRRIVAAAALALACRCGGAPCAPDGRVTLEGLLDEMLDEDAVTCRAELSWTGRLWSSYDRRSRKPGTADWFANDDRSQWVREESVSGRVERVMVDAKGPGALVRLWTANSYDTVLRFYVDGAVEPVIAGVATNLIGGHVLCGAPLADEVSPLQPPHQRAQDLYLPIPFASSLKVTAETRGIPLDDDAPDTMRFWYNAEVRGYPTNAVVESFSTSVLARAAHAIAAATAALAQPTPPKVTGRTSLDGPLAPGETCVRRLLGPGAVREIRLRLEPASAVRTVRMQIAFDDEETVDASVGQLLGGGYSPRAFATVGQSVDADGTMAVRYVMPFAHKCVVTLVNAGAEPCAVSGSSVGIGRYRWDEVRSMHFGALGFDLRELATRRGPFGYFDVPWLRLRGEGHLVGNALALDNGKASGNEWWGEGDEKISVDDEPFPSYFGTGTEDFFGYAWGSEQPFAAHPFLALPSTGATPENGRRFVLATRTRRLDTVPFARSLALDVELWHWTDCSVDYSPASFWYARPGVKIGR